MKTIQDYPTINERPPEGLKSDGTAFKVLVVDDSMFVAKQLGQILASEGYDVVATAVDGAEGVEKYKELCPHVDLVTMDITMPDVDGIQGLKSIREFDTNACVVMCSAMGQQAMVIEAIQGGAKDFIVKPFNPERVIEAVRRVLN